MIVFLLASYWWLLLRWLLTDFKQTKEINSYFTKFSHLKKLSHFTDFKQVKINATRTSVLWLDPSSGYSIQTESQKGLFCNKSAVLAKIPIDWTVLRRCLDAEVWFRNKAAVQAKIPIDWTLLKRCLDAEMWFCNKVVVQAKIPIDWTFIKNDL